MALREIGYDVGKRVQADQHKGPLANSVRMMSLSKIPLAKKQDNY
jgi:hypothetical protein